MPQRTEAVYSDGVLKPTRALSLRDQQRVRLLADTHLLGHQILP